MFQLACDEVTTNGYALASGGGFLDFLGQDEAIPIIAILLGSMVAVVAIVSSAIARVMRARAQEASRRELAAYVAEGTIEPDKAVALLNAGLPKWEASNFHKLMGRRCC